MTNLTGRTNGCAAAARGLARPRSGIGAVPENTPQRIACLGFRKQRAPRHRASMAEQADDAAGSTGGRWGPGGCRYQKLVRSEIVAHGALTGEESPA